MTFKTLSTEQELAVNAVRSWFNKGDGYTPRDPGDYFYLAGYAGTGKSTILPHIVDRCGLNPEDVVYCAPTGKAAKVMTTKLRADGHPNVARTIHSTIYIAGRCNVQKLESDRDGFEYTRDNTTPGTPRHNEAVVALRLVERDLKRAYNDKAVPNFSLNTHAFGSIDDYENGSTSRPRLIVVDEASMVGSEIAADLAHFGIPTIAMGDPGQLQPIKDKPGFMTRRPDFFLNEIHRQAADSPIIWLATLARNGEQLPYGVHGEGVRVIQRRNDDITTNPESEAQVIVGQNKTRWRLTKNMRDAFGYFSPAPEEGEPLVVTRNSLVVPKLVNGTPLMCVSDVDMTPGNEYVFIEAVDADKCVHNLQAAQSLFEQQLYRDPKAHTLGEGNDRQAYYAKIDNENVEFGWAITCHKSQGSQWDEVCVHDEGACFDDPMKWRYTAITRAAKRLTVING